MSGAILLFLVILSPIILKGLYDNHKAKSFGQKLKSERKADRDEIEGLLNNCDAIEFDEFNTESKKIEALEGASKEAAKKNLFSKYPYTTRDHKTFKYRQSLFFVQGVVTSKNYNNKGMIIDSDGNYVISPRWSITVKSPAGNLVECVFETAKDDESKIFESMTPNTSRITVKGVLTSSQHATKPLMKFFLLTSDIKHLVVQ